MAWHRWDPVFYSSAKLLDLNNLGRMWFSFKSNEYTKSNWRQSRCKCTENVCHLPNGQVWFMTWSPECRKSRIDLRAHAFRKQIRRKIRESTASNQRQFSFKVDECSCWSLKTTSSNGCNLCITSNDFQNTYITFSFLRCNLFSWCGTHKLSAVARFKLDGDVMMAFDSDDLVEMTSTHFVA